MTDFNKGCTGCGACADVCPFLAEFGTPEQILSDRPEATFYCTSCGRCDAVCFPGLSPAAALFETKQRLVQQQRIPPPVRKLLDRAQGFAKSGHEFPFSFYGAAESVFWPGCGLSANQPGLVRKVRKILSRHLQTKVGLVLDCCYEPVFELGDREAASAALKEISKRLHHCGVRQVITGCLNCHKLLSGHLPGIEVVFILEALPPELFMKQQRGPIYLHHPCSSAQWDEIRNAAQGVVSHIHPSDQPVTDLKSVPAKSDSVSHPIEASVPLCCGAGGGLSSLSPELANRFLDRIIREATDRTVLTYCVGCQSRFLKRGVEAVHLLECLTGAAPRRAVPSPLRQWLNRLALATAERLKESFA